MIKTADKTLAVELVKRGLLTSQSADKYLAEIKESNISLKDHLIQHGYVPERQVLGALASVLRLEYVDIKALEIEPAVLSKVPVRFAWYFKFMPIKLEGKTLTMACANPLEVKIQDEIRVHLGVEPRIVLAREADVLDYLNKYYGLAADTVDRLTKETPKQPALETDYSSWVEDLEVETEDASVSKLVNQILLEAYKKRATDIHIEPYRNKIRVRYRIDGILIDANIPQGAKHLLPSIISRIKILTNLSIVEKRLPQDGSTVVKTKEQDLDLRISTIPTPRGESMVIRILPTKVTLLSLERLGFDEKNLKTFRSIIQKPHGIILVTGPTGSGKTTTLYACLNAINDAQRKIITLEDPIEYEMEGITQIQVNNKVNLDFATGLRSVLRHDPDIIMVGEIRDLETAEIAIRTALTGHLVFSTLHTNDSASGITRLVEMGLEPFLVASSIESFVAQRLVRIICPHCKDQGTQPMPELHKEIRESLKLPEDQEVKIFNGRGCDYCNGTGFYGRTAIYEILVMDDDLRAAILERKRADEIKRLACQKGMITLRQDGWRKVLVGITTPNEVVNVTVRDEEMMPLKNLAPASQAEEPEMTTRIVAPEIFAAKNEYESRVYTRVVARVGIRYAIVRQDALDPTKLIIEKVEHSSISKDISAGGIRFVSGYALPIGTILDVKIQLKKGEPSIDCLAKICRVEDDTVSSLFNLVAYYLDIPSADRVRITSYIKSLPENKEN
jgi:type II secretory ATPase GspE/PulE/Tfp pilus assembly ATPase PilB-like protein